jgi:hypothetical protein
MLSVCNVSPGTHWMTLVDPKFISLTKLERESKTKMREFLDPRVANITSGGIDGYFAWPTSFISVSNLIWKMIWGSDCHVTISYRDVKIIVLNFILFNPSRKENQRQERGSFWVTNITSGGHKQKSLFFCFFNFLTSAWSLASWWISSLHFRDHWYTFWIYQSHPMSAPATQSVDSRARASFS